MEVESGTLREARKEHMLKGSQGNILAGAPYYNVSSIECLWKRGTEKDRRMLPYER